MAGSVSKHLAVPRPAPGPFEVPNGHKGHSTTGKREARAGVRARALSRAHLASW